MGLRTMDIDTIRLDPWERNNAFADGEKLFAPFKSLSTSLETEPTLLLALRSTVEIAELVVEATRFVVRVICEATFFALRLNLLPIFLNGLLTMLQ